MTQFMHREEKETWREAVARQGRKHGMELEVVAAFDAEIRANPEMDESQAAWCACYEWDALDYTPAETK